MVSTNCRELTGEGDCTLPLTGNSAQELQQNVFKHAQEDHSDKIKAMTSQDQSNMIRRIQEVYRQKSGVPVSR